MFVLESPPILDKMAPPCLRQALFSAGCFINSEARLGMTRGVWRTSVCYAGGTSPHPSYDNIGDHTEAVLVEYDPNALSYGQLLELFMFWLCSSLLKIEGDRHTPSIFVRNECERRLAQAALERSCIHCDAKANIMPFKTFHRAENWCQKYYLRIAPWLFDGLQYFYTDEEELLRSTTATRLNSYLGLASSGELKPDCIEMCGLSLGALEALKNQLSNRG